MRYKAVAQCLKSWLRRDHFPVGLEEVLRIKRVIEQQAKADAQAFIQPCHIETEKIMSRTYELVCTDCRISLWVAQGYVRAGDTLAEIQAQGVLYNTDEHLSNLRDFLFLHMGHPLVFNDDEFMANEEYSDFKPDEVV